MRGGYGGDPDTGRGGRGFSDRGGSFAGRAAGRTPGGGRGQQAAARGRGRGGVWREKEPQENNSTLSRKRSSGDAGLHQGDGNELTDTASSPLKCIQEGVEGGGVRPKAQKQLLLTANAVEGTGSGVPPPPPAYVPPKELKRQKKEKAAMGEEKRAVNNDKAGSSEGRRKQQ